jgi:hypothetical protein
MWRMRLRTRSNANAPLVLRTRCGVALYRPLVHRSMQSPALTTKVPGMYGAWSHDPSGALTSRPPHESYHWVRSTIAVSICQ